MRGLYAFYSYCHDWILVGWKDVAPFLGSIQEARLQKTGWTSHQKSFGPGLRMKICFAGIMGSRYRLSRKSVELCVRRSDKCRLNVDATSICRPHLPQAIEIGIAVSQEVSERTRTKRSTRMMSCSHAIKTVWFNGSRSVGCGFRVVCRQKEDAASFQVLLKGLEEFAF